MPLMRRFAVGLVSHSGEAAFRVPSRHVITSGGKRGIVEIPVEPRVP